MADRPLVTVIMPVRNEAGYIGAALRSVFGQEYPTDRIEVLVVDGCSDDGTAAEVEALRRDLGLDAGRVRVLTNEARTVPAALNLGIDRARGSVILRVDGHCELSPTYLATCVDLLESTGAACVGGVLDSRGEGRTGQAVAAAQSSWFGAGDASFRRGASTGREVDTLAFGAYRRDVLDALGPFDEELVRNQDDEMNLRLTRSGRTIWLEPSIQAVYHTRSSMKGLARQYFQYGLFKVRVAQKHRGVGTARQLVPAGFVTALVGSAALAATGHRLPLRLLLAAYGTTALVATAGAAPPSPAAAARLPAVFLTMHLAYGTGYLAGIGYWTLSSPGARDWRLSR